MTHYIHNGETLRRGKEGKRARRKTQLLLTAAVPFIRAHSSQRRTATSCLSCATAIPTGHHVSCGLFVTRLKTPFKHVSQHVKRREGCLKCAGHCGSAATRQQKNKTNLKLESDDLLAAVAMQQAKNCLGKTAFWDFVILSEIARTKKLLQVQLCVCVCLCTYNYSPQRCVLYCKKQLF